MGACWLGRNAVFRPVRIGVGLSCGGSELHVRYEHLREEERSPWQCERSKQERGFVGERMKFL